MRAALGLGWRLYERDGLTDGALPMLEKARELAARLDDEASLAEALIRLEVLGVVRGDLRAASDHARAAAPLLELYPARFARPANELESPQGAHPRGSPGRVPAVRGARDFPPGRGGNGAGGRGGPRRGHGPGRLRASGSRENRIKLFFAGASEVTRPPTR